MVTKTIDVPLPDSLQSFLAQPVCVTLPPPANVKINLPMGGTLLRGATTASPSSSA